MKMQQISVKNITSKKFQKSIDILSRKWYDNSKLKQILIQYYKCNKFQIGGVKMKAVRMYAPRDLRVEEVDIPSYETD